MRDFLLWNYNVINVVLCIYFSDTKILLLMSFLKEKKVGDKKVKYIYFIFGVKVLK